jgi:hypothetical protein
VLTAAAVGRRRPRGRRPLLGALLLTGLAGALAIASVGLLRGARSVHVRPVVEGIGADAGVPGTTTGFAASSARLDGPARP